ncbi:MAG: hypothetical protein ABGW95_02395, partial [Candidatus Poseidoniia archaeon]
QSIASAHWRQLDPGVLPAGDVYGAGAPTGIVFNEGDGLGARYRGLLISADSALETLLAYRPTARGAGFSLERFDLATTNAKRGLSGTDTSRGVPMTGIVGYFGRKAGESRALGYGPAWFEKVSRQLGIDRAYTAPRDAGPLRFRPSDVAIGTDGALYVADWLDAFVGGNSMSDLERRGAIYRIAPRGSSPVAPELDASTPDGAVELLRSPAVNVRALGFDALRARGGEVLSLVEGLLADADEFVRMRAVWLLPHLGDAPGKGEALWKSLYILNGDIIAWIDTDIKNIHPQFVYGVVGPILRHPQVQYVKGFYHRPLKVDGGLLKTGGGRVTDAQDKILASAILKIYVDPGIIEQGEGYKFSASGLYYV